MTDRPSPMGLRGWLTVAGHRYTFRLSKAISMLKRVDFFRELTAVASDLSLPVHARGVEGPWEHPLIAYLSAGALFVGSPGPVWDVLDGRGPIGTAGILTDGIWTWPEVLSYYVQKYHIVLPAEFIEHAQAQGWAVPRLQLAELRRLYRQAYSGRARR